jgi:hypothetical protein
MSTIAGAVRSVDDHAVRRPPGAAPAQFGRCHCHLFALPHLAVWSATLPPESEGIKDAIGHRTHAIRRRTPWSLGPLRPYAEAFRRHRPLVPPRCRPMLGRRRPCVTRVSPVNHPRGRADRAPGPSPPGSNQGLGCRRLDVRAPLVTGLLLPRLPGAAFIPVVRRSRPPRDHDRRRASDCGPRAQQRSAATGVAQRSCRPGTRRGNRASRSGRSRRRARR